MRREVLRQYLADHDPGPFVDRGGAGVEPVGGAEPVADLRVDVFGLHDRQRLVGAEEVAVAVDDRADGLDGELVGGDLDASHGAVDGAEHVVVDDERLVGAGQQAGEHPG